MALEPDYHFEGSEADVSFHGYLKRKPCRINNDEDINIEFGKVRIKKIDGVKYKQKIPYKIKCEEYSPELTLTMAINGTPSIIGDSVLKTSVTGLGIKILGGGEDFKLNNKVITNFDRWLVLEAVPVWDGTTTLPESKFDATATLLAEYL